MGHHQYDDKIENEDDILEELQYCRCHNAISSFYFILHYKS